MSNYGSFLRGSTEDKKRVMRYTLDEIIKEYENGFGGNFTLGDEIYTYDILSGTILHLTQSGKHPAFIDSKFLKSMFRLRRNFIGIEDVITVIKNNGKVYFMANIAGFEYYGWLMGKDGRIISHINNNKSKELDDKDLIMNAMIYGKWYI